MEVWKDIEEYEGVYQISSAGNVKSLSRIVRFMRMGKPYYRSITERELVQAVRWDKYRRIQLNRKMHSIHRLVAQAFIPNPENKRCINHKDFDKANNRVNNLEWVTHLENSDHAIRGGHSNKRNG